MRSMIGILQATSDFETIENIREFYIYFIQRKLEIRKFPEIIKGIFNHEPTLKKLFASIKDLSSPQKIKIPSQILEFLLTSMKTSKD